MTEKEIQALISLLDDTDFDIRNHVEEKIISIGRAAIPYLEREWSNNLDQDLQNRVEELIHLLQLDILKGRLRDWKSRGCLNLLEGMWIITTYQYPDLKLKVLESKIKELTGAASKRLDFLRKPTDKIKALNGFLFGKMRFRPNTQNFHSPANSMINIVLESRKASPVALCALYILIAERTDLPVYGVNLPNLFVLTYKSEETQFYINAFNDGLIFTKNDIDRYVEKLKVKPEDSFYQPCSNRDIILRTLSELAYSFNKLGEKAKQEEIQLLAEIVAEDY